MAKMRYYLDEMMPRAVANEVRKQGYEVVMAIDVGMTEKEDPEHLEYATQHGLALVTQDQPFAGQTAQRSDHAGLICWLGKPGVVGTLVRALVDFSEKYTAE